MFWRVVLAATTVCFMGLRVVGSSQRWQIGGSTFYATLLCRYRNIQFCPSKFGSDTPRRAMLFPYHENSMPQKDRLGKEAAVEVSIYLL